MVWEIGGAGAPWADGPKGVKTWGGGGPLVAGVSLGAFLRSSGFSLYVGANLTGEKKTNPTIKPQLGACLATKKKTPLGGGDGLRTAWAKHFGKTYCFWAIVCFPSRPQRGGNGKGEKTPISPGRCPTGPFFTGGGGGGAVGFCCDGAIAYSASPGKE